MSDLQVKVKKRINCKFGVTVLPNKFYPATRGETYFYLKLGDGFGVMVANKNIKQVMKCS